MTNHATFDTQLHHVSVSCVHAQMQAIIEYGNLVSVQVNDFENCTMSQPAIDEGSGVGHCCNDREW